MADESCDFSVVRALRAAGFDVLAITESSAGAADADVLATALRENRILITEDKDFGRLVFAANRETAGVVLLRFRAKERDTVARRTVETLAREEGRLAGAFLVIQPRRTRLTRLT